MPVSIPYPEERPEKWLTSADSALIIHSNRGERVVLRVRLRAESRRYGARRGQRAKEWTLEGGAERRGFAAHQ